MHLGGAGDEDGEAAPVSGEGSGWAKTAVQAGERSAEDRLRSSLALVAEFEHVGRPLAADSYGQSADDDLSSRVSNLCVPADALTGSEREGENREKRRRSLSKSTHGLPQRGQIFQVNHSDRGDGGGAADHNRKECNANNKWPTYWKDDGGSACSQEVPTFNMAGEMLSSESLQQKVESALRSIRTNSTRLHVSGLASSLREIIINFSQHLSESRGNRTRWEAAEHLPKGLPLLLESLALFLSVFDMSPPPILFKGKEREQGAGLHRIALVELLNLLLVPASPYIEERLIAEETPARLISLVFQFPWNSILQGAIFRSLQAMLGKPSLRYSMFEETAALSSILLEFGEECVAHPMRKRPGYSGFFLRLSEEIRFIAKQDPKVQNLLAHNEKWTSYAGPGGILEHLLAEHAGQLSTLFWSQTVT